MKDFIEKIKRIRDEIERKRGPLTLVALFQRYETPTWDLVFSAPWLDSQNIEDLHFLLDHVKKHMTVNDLLKITAVFRISNDDPRLEDVFEFVDTSNGIVRITDETYFDMDMRKAYFITVRKPEETPKTATA